MNPFPAIYRTFTHPQKTDARDLWLTRLFYLVYFGGSAFITPFFTLFYQRQGLSGAEIGTLSTLGSLCTMIAAPVWARLAGSIIRTKRAIQFGVIASGLSLLLLSQQQHFGGMAAVIVARMLLTGGVGPLTISLVLKVLERNPGVGFGSVRVWASLGWAFTSLIAGFVIEKSSFTAAFLIAAAVVFASAAFLNPIQEDPPAPRPAAEDPAAVRGSRRLLQLVSADFQVLRNPALLLLTIAMGITWIAQAGALNFQAIYMDELGAGESLIGVMNMLGATIELPAMFWADRLERRHGPVRLLVAAFILNGLGYLGVVLFPSITFILIGRAIGGLVLSLTSVSEMRYIQMNTPPEKTGSAIALITVTINAMITITISPIAGWLFDARGAPVLFVIAAGGYAVGAGVMALALRKQPSAQA